MKSSHYTQNFRTRVQKFYAFRKAYMEKIASAIPRGSNVFQEREIYRARNCHPVYLNEN